MIDKIDEGAKKNGKSFTATRGCIYQTTFTIDNMLPGFLLEMERVKAFGGKPFINYFIPFCGLQ